MANSGIYEDDYGSDHGSLYADADSPADGYFTQRPFPTSQFVENSSITAEADAKAQEAAESRASSSDAQPSSQRSSPAFTTRSLVWAQPDEQAPLLDAGPAPPDYAAATAHRRGESANSPPASEQPERPQNYGSISESRDEHEEPSSAGNDHQWPLGNRGNPFHSQNFPFGPNGNPMSNPNFPLGPSGSPFRAGNVLFPSGQPQSMSNEPPRYSDRANTDEEIGTTARYRNRIDRRGWRRLAGFCQTSTTLSWLLVLGLVAIVFVFGLGDSGSHDYRNAPSAGDNPGKTPASDGDGDNKSPTEPQQPDEPPKSSLPPHRTSQSCKLYHYSQESNWTFGGNSNFSFYELMEPRTSMSLSVSGTVYLQPALPEQEHDISVTASYATSQYWRVISPLHYLYETDIGSLQLQFPNVVKTAGPEVDEDYPCMDVVVAIRIKEGVIIDNWDIVTANLNVVADEGIFHTRLPTRFQPVQIANLTTINTIRGNVNLEYWNSRNTRVETTSGSIKGLYALRDLLSLKTTSGTISIMVDPKPADKEHPMPADFSAISDSGSVRVSFPMEGTIPDREYRSRVDTQSGTIAGDYILGIMSTFRSTSGSITAHVLPYDWDTYASGLHSETNSGSTVIAVLPSYKGPDKPMNRMRSFHKSSAGSGTVTLRYPAQWSGVIDAETKSGSLAVSGNGLVVDVATDLPPSGKMLVGHKGRGGSRVDIRSGSGSVYFKIGE